MTKTSLFPTVKTNDIPLMRTILTDRDTFLYLFLGTALSGAVIADVLTEAEKNRLYQKAMEDFILAAEAAIKTEYGETRVPNGATVELLAPYGPYKPGDTLIIKDSCLTDGPEDEESWFNYTVSGEKNNHEVNLYRHEFHVLSEPDHTGRCYDYQAETD